MSDEGLAPGKRLSEIRQQQGLSQRRAAELSGLTHSAISTIEQDKVSPAKAAEGVWSVTLGILFRAGKT